MTLIIGLIAKDGIVITADSRMTQGNPQASSTQANDTVRKIFKITNYSAMGVAGSGEIAVTLIEEFIQHVDAINNQNFTVYEIAEAFRQFCVGKYSNWFQRLPAESNLIPSFSVLICGYGKFENNTLSNPKIIRIESGSQFAPMTTTTGFATLGIPTLANYLLNRLYLIDEITTEKALILGAYCIVETESQDGRVGGQLQAVKFSNTDPIIELSEKEINDLTIQCAELLKNTLQVSFYKPAPKKEPVEAITSGPASPNTDAEKTSKTSESKRT